jgi:type IV pilus assembly protein PilA
MRSGFTLIELMVVVAIVAVLTMLAVPTFTTFIAKAKRTEAYTNLHALYAAQKAYWAEHGTYTTQLGGTDGLGWKPTGYKGGGAQESFYYTYGVPGTEGVNFFTGKLEAPASALSGGYANKDGFVMVAAGDIDNDGALDIITIDQDNNVQIAQSDI